MDSVRSLVRRRRRIVSGKCQERQRTSFSVPKVVRGGLKRKRV